MLMFCLGWCFNFNMAVKEIEIFDDQYSEVNVGNIEWNVETEVQLLYAMIGHKPVGANKHFQMAAIIEKFRNSLNKKVTTKGIWKQLESMYDLQALDDTENLPFPNEKSDFRLPDEYMAAKKMKQGNSPESIKSESDIKSETKLKKDMNKESGKKEGVKEVSKESKKDIRDSIKELRKSLGSKDLKERKENKDIKEMKQELKKEFKDLAKELKKDLEDNQEVKTPKYKESAKEKRFKKEESDKDTSPISSPSLSKKDRLKELLGETKSDDSPKRGGKRSTRGSIKSDDASSTKSSSPISATPPPFKRRRL